MFYLLYLYTGFILKTITNATACLLRAESYVYEKNGFFSRTYSPFVEISESSWYEEGEWEERANVRSHPNPTCYILLQQSKTTLMPALSKDYFGCCKHSLQLLSFFSIGLSQKLRRDADRKSFVVFEDTDLERRKRGEEQFFKTSVKTDYSTRDTFYLEPCNFALNPFQDFVLT